MRFFLMISVIFASLTGAALAEEEARLIAVTGEGVVQAAPDMATVSIGVTREARTAGQAMSEASSAMSAVIAAIDAAGIEARDIQTSNIGLSPRYQHSNDGRPPRVTGYVANNTLMVRVRALDALGGVLDAVVSDGANALNGLSFGIADSAPLEARARAEAVADARAKAEGLAEAAGVTLGPVMSIVEAGRGGLPQPMMRGAVMEAAMDVPVAAGELEIRRQVSMTFAIAE